MVCVVPVSSTEGGNDYIFIMKSYKKYTLGQLFVGDLPNDASIEGLSSADCKIIKAMVRHDPLDEM